MKVVILAGGLGTRLAEQTEVKPKPMVEIGEKPILWHIMKQYRHYGLDEFVVALGYKGEVIKRWFVDEVTLAGPMTVDGRRGVIRPRDHEPDPWVAHLVNTGLTTNTGGRIRRLRKWVGGETFMATYGDGVSDIDLQALLRFHKSHGKLATITAVRPPARYGGLHFEGDLVASFTEKPQAGEGWINGGFMVLEPAVLDRIEGDSTSFESEVLEKLAGERQLGAYRHAGFWQCMDTLRDMRLLQSLWSEGRAPWRMWT